MHHVINRSLVWIQTHKKKFAKYFVVGFSGLILDIGLLYIASDVLRIRPLLALLVTQIIVIVYNFLLNKYWSFESRGAHGRQLLRYSVVLGFNYLFGEAAMYVGNEVFGIHHLLIRAATVALAVSWNFLLYNYWVYKD
ncbi:MAG: GtrA family protein [Candidatus Magasanikbacteria bacterium]|nr:GtrA family protein [Candidatus Magasanikbacteria bacterium]